MGNSVMAPAGVILPTLLPLCSMNQRLPSGPAVIASGPLPAVGTANSVIPERGMGLAVLTPEVTATVTLAGAGAGAIPSAAGALTFVTVTVAVTKAAWV